MSTGTTPNDLLLDQARYFEDGDYERLVPTLALPTIIHVDNRRMVLMSPDDIERNLRAFRENLMVEGYARTKVQVFHQETGSDGRCRALLRWTNVNERDGEINTMDASWFCRRMAEGDWRVELIEIVCEGGRNLAVGLPLH